MRPNAFKPALSVTALEDRYTPAITAAVNAQFGYLTVTGDGAADTIVVREQNGMLSVDGIKIKVGTAMKSSVPAKGGFLVVEAKGGSDRIDVSKVKTVSGQLYGGTGDDTVFGTPKGDIIHGGENNDNLYGGEGDDLLYGGSGMDGLYGGAGADGGYGDDVLGTQFPDRFLLTTGNPDGYSDVKGGDAVVRFKNGGRDWRASEIVAVDAGLRHLHLRTGNDNLLERADGGGVTIVRGATKGDTYATNHENGTLTFYDKAFSSAGATTATTIHEFGHNWDDKEEMGNARWKDWLALSGWSKTSGPGKVKSGDGEWFHNSNAKFALGYGKTSPFEDFSTAWESYFIHKFGLANPEGVAKLSTAKFNHLDALFDSLS